ncbi:hypothetical protein BDV95DRAFT_492341 [Massariosphaeria phaeospora]|uniref:Uncharacterized protein n=1 Tax=Massariosphaeria phaeospora TaxID=100035 RepID=A0A7C8M758_9PLEO|nr:hypothetical protein BDV95DRAFT_492341 [Massariosphaeria phaeospora]
MASTRLRRTFHYPTDSEDDDAVEEGMDEQDQEELISKLSTHDTSSTRLYMRILLVLPLAPILLYLPRLVNPSTFLPSLVAISTFLATAYTLYFLPLPPVRVTVTNTAALKSDPSRKGKSISRDSHGLRAAAQTPDRPAVPYVSNETADLLARYIVTVNGVVCMLLAVAELWRGKEWKEGIMIGGGYVPGTVLAVVLWARRELRVVDLGELEKLRYRGKSS